MIATALPALKAGAVAMAVLVILATATAAVVRGGSGAVAAGAGVALVAVFFVGGKLALVAAGRTIGPMLLPVALAIYATKVVVLGGLLVVLQGTSGFDLISFAWAIVAGTLCWVGAELWAATRLRVPFYDPTTFGRPPGEVESSTEEPGRC